MTFASLSFIPLHTKSRCRDGDRDHDKYPPPALPPAAADYRCGSTINDGDGDATWHIIMPYPQMILILRYNCFGTQQLTDRRVA